MHKRLVILFLAGLCSIGAAAQDHTFHKMAFEMLPSLNAPRGNHRTVVFDGEVAVFGGHTTGFKPLETAEYYKNGSWHSIPMTWPHDGGAITLLKDGRLFLAGGVGILADEPGLTDDNFNPLADAYLFHTEEPAKTAGVPVWAIVLGSVLVCAVVLLLVIRKKEPAPEPVVEKAQKLNADLLEEMQHLIEENNLFLRKDLRVADIASELATNQTYVSVLVNNLTGDNFATMRKPEKNTSVQVIGIKTMVMAGTIPASLKIWEEKNEQEISKNHHSCGTWRGREVPLDLCAEYV